METSANAEPTRRRTWKRLILIPALTGLVVGFLVSYAPFFPPKYTATATVLVEGQRVPASYVQPIITTAFPERVQTLYQQVLSESRLRPVIRSLDLVKPGEEGKLMEQIRANMQVTPVITSMSAAALLFEDSGGEKKPPSPIDEPLPGFNVSYSDKYPERAQKICNALTSLILDENLKSRGEAAKSTTDFLGRQVEDAKRAIDEKDKELAAFKQRHFGQLPGDVENNMRMLMSLTQQLDATTQNLNRAQRDKTYTEGLLAQQLAAWKSSQSSTNPQTQQQLSELREQLVQLRARYTDDHQDVDIAKLQSRLDEINKQTGNVIDSGEKANAHEPPEIRQFRFLIFEYQTVIEEATADQKKLQAAIKVYERRVAMSPAIEEMWKNLTSDYDNGQAFYRDLLAKKSSADLAFNMEVQQLGEQMHILAIASLPDSPSFPVRPLFALGGFGTGLALGIGLALWRRFRPPAYIPDEPI